MPLTETTTATREIVEAFFQRLAARDPVRIAELFADRVDWFIPGNETLAPWLGRRGTRDDVVAFFRLLFANVEPLRAEVQQVLVDGESAIATGEFASRMLATGKVVESIFFTHVTVRDRQIVRYRLLEDSHAVTVALTRAASSSPAPYTRAPASPRTPARRPTTPSSRPASSARTTTPSGTSPRPTTPMRIASRSSTSTPPPARPGTRRPPSRSGVQS